MTHLDPAYRWLNDAWFVEPSKSQMRFRAQQTLRGSPVRIMVDPIPANPRVKALVGRTRHHANHTVVLEGAPLKVGLRRSARSGGVR